MIKYQQHLLCHAGENTNSADGLDESRAHRGACRWTWA